MKVKIVSLVLIVAVAGAILVNSNVSYQWQFDPLGNLTGQDNLKKFNSAGEIKSFLEKNTARRNYEWSRVLGFASKSMGAAEADAPAASFMPQQSDGASDFSTTNIQVAGVDEADIVKNDGKYIYVLSGRTVSIVDAYPPEYSEVVSTVSVRGNPREIYINGDRLIVLGEDYNYVEYPEIEEKRQKTSADVIESIMPRPPKRANRMAVLNVYDIANRRDPKLVREVFVDGLYFDSRMIGDFVYVIATENAYYNDVRIPEITEPGTPPQRPDVYYFDDSADSYSFTTIISVDVQNNEKEAYGKIYLLGSARNLYVSKNNIYVTYQNEETVVHKIAIDNGEIEYTASGKVPGRVLNQFSMDEYGGYFRIATTGHVSERGSYASANNIYVLSGELEIVGELEDLAPGERIYSARFMGRRAYLVTFKKVDPLFVIDLSNPENPEVLGKLKIPGYSDYLHPYDENHIIGLGKDTIEAERGDFAWYQGIKLALFDVSDVENPKEISKFVIGDRGTDSHALRDHKAFLFSREKNLLVIPVLLARIDVDRYYGELPANAYGEYVWQGAYVFNVNTDRGIVLKGKVSHSEDAYGPKKGRKFYQNPKYAIKRSLYMDDTLYTISDGMIKMNDLYDLYEINRLRLGSHVGRR